MHALVIWMDEAPTVEAAEQARSVPGAFSVVAVSEPSGWMRLDWMGRFKEREPQNTGFLTRDDFLSFPSLPSESDRDGGTIFDTLFRLGGKTGLLRVSNGPPFGIQVGSFLEFVVSQDFFPDMEFLWEMFRVLVTLYPVPNFIQGQ